MASIQANSYASGTWRTLRSQWKSFSSVVRAIHLRSPTSFTPDTTYASFLSWKTSSFNYVMNHLNAACLLFLYKGFSTELFNSFTLNLTKKGLKRIKGSSPRQKHPITSDILVSTRRSLNLTTPSHTALWACLPQCSFPFCTSQIWSWLQHLRSIPINTWLGMMSISPTLAPYYVSSGPKHVSLKKEFTSSHFQAFQTRHSVLRQLFVIISFFCLLTYRCLNRLHSTHY